MKNIFNKFAFFIALSFVFISCGNLTTSENDDSIPQGKGKITISTDLQNGRSVLPTAIDETTTGLKWELTGIKDGETTSNVIKYWTDGNSGTAYKSMTSNSGIVIDTGTWDFTLTASNTDGQNVLSATISTTINAGENKLNFVMQEATENAASGSIEFTLNFPKDVVDNVEATLYKYDNANNVVDTNRQLTIDNSSNNNFDSVKYSYPDTTGTTSSPLSAGYYILKIELQQEKGDATTPAVEDKTINTYSCLIRVAPGLSSIGKYTLPGLAQLYTVNYECNQGSIGNPLTTTSYNAYTSFELPEPTYQGHYFAGWYTQEYADDGTLKEEKFVGNAGDTITINKDTTLYAKYVKAYEFNLYDLTGKEVENSYKVENGIGSVTLSNKGNSVWDYYLKSKLTDIEFTEKNNYKITVEMKAEADSVVAIQAANADMFFTVGTEWTTCTMETGFIEKELDTSRNGISFGLGLSEITYFRNLVIEPISSDDDGLPTLVFDITTEGINQYLNTQNKADKIIEVKKVVDASGMATGYAITINAPLSHKDENNVVQQDVKLHLRDYAKSVGVNNVSFKVSNTGEYPFATSFMADTASNNSMAWNNVRTPVAKNGFNTCKIDFPNYAVNDELTVDVITGSDNVYSNYPVEFTISEFKVTNIESPATPFENKIFAIKTGNTWTRSKEVEVSIPVNGNINFDVGMFSSWDTTTNNNMPSFEDVTRFFYTGNIPEGLTYSTGTDDSGPTYTVTNNSNAAKIVKISLNEKYEVVIEDVSTTVTTWEGLNYRITNTSISNFVIKNDLTVTESITISRKVMITAEKNVIISRGASCGFFVINSGSLELGSNDCTITLDGGNTTDYATTKGPLIWQYSGGQGVTLTNCILQNNTLHDPGYEQGAAIKTENSFTMNNCSIRNCQGSEGGAVYIFANGSFTMNGGSISGCTATAGGAVYLYNGSFTMSGDAYIDSNNDVYLAYGKTVTVAADLSKEFVATITLSSYDVGTPVITAADDNVILADKVGKFTLKNENYKISDDGTVAQNSGGGGTVNPDVTVTSWSTLKSTIESIDTTYTEENPYVIGIASDITTSADTAAEITVSSHVKLVSNTDCIITRTSDFAGVNLFKVNTEASLTIGDTNAGGTLTLDGGGTDVSATKSLVNVSGTLVLNEKSVLQNNNCPDSFATSGAAVYSSGGTLKVFGSTIKNNSNNHSSNFGGAIYIKNGTLNITSGTFEENKTNKNGGAIYVTEGTVNITGGNFINNKVSTGSNKTETSYGGGAIYIDSAETSISAATFESNITEDGVGTLLITNIGTETSPAMIYNCTFTNNTAYQKGAAIYTGGTSYIEINDCTFTGNTLSIDGSHDVYIGNTGGTTKINGSAMTGAWTSSSN